MRLRYVILVKENSQNEYSVKVALIETNVIFQPFSACPTPVFGILPASLSEYHLLACFPLWSEVGVRYPGTRVTGCCGPPFGCWESNLGAVEEQPVALNF